jgi:hypothetical protein
MEKTELIARLRASLPVIWERAMTDKLTGGAVKASSLAVYMCRGQGPTNTFKMGRRVIIEKEGFLDWFAARVEI